MSWIVRVALHRPYTFVVMAVMILIFGVFAAIRTPVDIFPEIPIPVVGVVWQYTGLSAYEMSARIVNTHERILSTTVNDIDHTESQSIPGNGVIKVYFQPGTDIRLATAQVTAIAPIAIRQMPPGISSPIIMNYSATTVPILQLAQSSSTLTEQQLNDLTQTVLRPALISIPGMSMPQAYGGRVRQLQIDLDPRALLAQNLSAQDVQAAIAAQSQIVPAGAVKIGDLQYVVKLNSAAEGVDEMNALPIRTADGVTVQMGDVAHVRDGSPPQTNVVHVDGKRATLSNVFKNGSVSTLAIVQDVKDRLPKALEQLPDDYKVTLLNDQSLFVKNAVSGVVREGVLAALLTSLLIYLFLGSWRSTVVIAASIPLSVLAAVAGLSALGETLNIMTLGGLALAVGILVDDATVTIENINWHLEQGKDVRTAILDGANQIVAPAFVSLLCICIVFIPMFQLQGVAGFLFVPLAKAVILAMVASFLLSRTLVPTMAMYLLRPHGHERTAAPPRNLPVRLQRAFEVWFAARREAYRDLLTGLMGRRLGFVAGFMAVVALSLGLTPLLGQNFFPAVDAGLISIQVRGPAGLRVENTSELFARVEARIREVVPPDELGAIVDNIGTPVLGLSQLHRSVGVIGSQDGEIFVSLKPGHGPTAAHVKRLRESLPRAFPGVTFAFVPADMVGQILNFGSPAPIDLQIVGANPENRAYATLLLRRLREIPGLADVRLHQTEGAPQLKIDIDRARIAQVGLTERDVTSSVLTFLSGSGQLSPNFWLNPKNGVSYPIVAQAPEYRIHTLSELENLPITGPGSKGAQVLGGLGRITRSSTPAVVNHYDIQTVLNIFATPQGRDLGGVAADLRKVIRDTEDQVPKGSSVNLRGQAVTMQTAFTSLFLGVLAAIVLVYLVIVVNFQSWTDPFVIITALPAALAGIVWILFATGTTLSVPALTGSIMCMGVATANSILVVSFARERLAAGADAVAAAIEAGVTRFRPVIMTALAMIVGMAPMALGLGEGAEQNAPLGRAVIGGLLFATVATLIFVPVVFSLVHERRARVTAASPREAHA